MAPIRVYLLLLDHPASRIPSTPIDDTAMMKNTPMLKSTTCIPLPHGRHAKVITDAITTRKGARKNRNLSVCHKVMISLVKILNTSAKICNEPHGPTRMGPRRH